MISSFIQHIVTYVLLGRKCISDGALYATEYYPKYCISVFPNKQAYNTFTEYEHYAR